jgi:hypothetical protein
MLTTYDSSDSETDFNDYEVNVIDMLVWDGKLNAIKWLITNGYKWDFSSTIKFAKDRHTAVVTWLESVLT